MEHSRTLRQFVIPARRPDDAFLLVEQIERIRMRSNAPVTTNVISTGWEGGKAYPSPATRVIGKNEIVRIAEFFSECGGVPSHISYYALLGDSANLNYGAPRNIGLLLDFDVIALSLDSDTSLKIKCAPNSDVFSTAFGGHSPPWMLDCYESKAKLYGSLFPPSGLNIIKEFEDALNYDLLKIDQRESLCEHLAQGGGEIVCASAGVYGDSGMSTHDKVLLDPDLSKPEVCKLPVARTSRLTVRQALVRTVYHPTSFISTCFAYKPAGIDVPFMPSGRGEDAVFAAMIFKFCKDKYFAELPFCVGHYSTTLTSPQLLTGRMSFGQLMQALVLSSQSEDLIGFSHEVKNILGRPTKDLIDSIALTILPFLRGRLKKVLHGYQCNENPALRALRDDVALACELDILDTARLLPEDCADIRGLHRRLLNFVEFLEAWPVMRSCAQQAGGLTNLLK